MLTLFRKLTSVAVSVLCNNRAEMENYVRP
jgi:hypothetical protein